MIIIIEQCMVNGFLAEFQCSQVKVLIYCQSVATCDCTELNCKTIVRITAAGTIFKYNNSVVFFHYI